MLSFENWLETRQGKFFQEKIGKEKWHLSEDELKKIYVIFKNHCVDDNVESQHKTHTKRKPNGVVTI